MVRRRPAALHVSVWLHDRRSRWHEFRSAVSLHAHTSYSREQLADLPRYLVQIPFVGSRVERELRTQCAVDFSKGWWHPPVSAREVFDAEIGADRGPPAAVAAGVAYGSRRPARRARRAAGAPVVARPDLVRVDGAVRPRLLPPRRAQPAPPPTPPAGSRGCRRSRPAPRSAHPAWRCSTTCTPAATCCVVFNHPWWDLADVGAGTHTAMLQHFLRAHRAAPARARAERLSQPGRERPRADAGGRGRPAGHLRRRLARLRAQCPAQPDDRHHLRGVRRGGPRRLQPGADHARVPPAPAAADPGVRLWTSWATIPGGPTGSTGPIASPMKPTA